MVPFRGDDTIAALGSSAKGNQETSSYSSAKRTEDVSGGSISFLILHIRVSTVKLTAIQRSQALSRGFAGCA